MAYFCHQCQRIVDVSVTPDLHCSNCDSEFIEEVRGSDRPADADSGNATVGDGGPPPRGFMIIRHHIEPTAEDAILAPPQPSVSAAQNPFLNLFNPAVFGNVLTRMMQQQPASAPGGGGLFDSAQAPPTSSTSSGSGEAGGSRAGGRTAGGNPSGGPAPNNENAVNFINQLLSNLVENANQGQPITRLTFHFGPPPPQGVDGDSDGLPFPLLQNLLHGNVNDYAWGPEGLDAIATQLLNQFDNGPAPHVPPADLQRLPMTEVTEAHVENGTQCATCMETFQLKEAVAQLDCRHIFHRPCIEPWLKKQNTCPICRKVVDPKMWGDGDVRPIEIVDIDELD